MSAPTPAPATKPEDTRILVSPGAPLFGELPPQYAALARGVLVAAAIAALGVIIQAFQTGTIQLPPEYSYIGSIVVLVAQAIIGAIDSHSVNTTTKALAAKERAREAAASVSHTGNGTAAIVTAPLAVTAASLPLDPQPEQPPAAPKVTRPPRTPKPKAAASQPTVTPAPKPKTAKASAKGSPAPKPAKGGAK